MDELSYVFGGLGLFPDDESLKLDPSVFPVIHLEQRLLYTLRNSIKKVERMADLGVYIDNLGKLNGHSLQAK